MRDLVRDESRRGLARRRRSGHHTRSPVRRRPKTSPPRTLLTPERRDAPGWVPNPDSVLRQTLRRSPSPSPGRRDHRWCPGPRANMMPHRQRRSASAVGTRVTASSVPGACTRRGAKGWWAPSDTSCLARRAPQMSITSSSECLRVAAQLNEHHAPETNGRIPVCHRCGARLRGQRHT
jgi:hypothetical protein